MRIFGPVIQEPQPRPQVSDAREAALRMAGRALVGERLRGLRKVVGRRLAPRDLVLRTSPSDVRRHLLDEARELYWNEMEWERLTDEEQVTGDRLVEMAFPGLLALIDAFLPRAPNGEPDRDRERRDVVHDFLEWLGARFVDLGETRDEARHERDAAARQHEITDRLIDLILFRLCALSEAEIERYRRA